MTEALKFPNFLRVGCTTLPSTDPAEVQPSQSHSYGLRAGEEISGLLLSFAKAGLFFGLNPESFTKERFISLTFAAPWSIRFTGVGFSHGVNIIKNEDDEPVYDQVGDTYAKAIAAAAKEKGVPVVSYENFIHVSHEVEDQVKWPRLLLQALEAYASSCGEQELAIQTQGAIKRLGKSTSVNELLM